MSGCIDRILTTHVGSEVRPPQLMEYIRAFDEAIVEAQVLYALLNDEINKVIKRQEEVGIDIVSDGSLAS